MAFFSLAALRIILDTETDADSPGSEELLGQIRENLEAIIMLAFDTGITTTCTGISETVFTDSGSPFANVEVGMTLLITSGTAKGNTYTIDATNSTTTVTCTGDTLQSDGVAATDTAKVLYDLKVNADGHDHDGVNSKSVVLADGVIVEAKLGDVYRQLISEPTSTAHTSTDAAWTTIETYPFYRTAGMDTMSITCVFKVTGGETVYWRVTIDAQASTVDNTSSGSYVGSTISADISGASTGWRFLLLEMYTTNGATGTVAQMGAVVHG